MLKIFKVKGDSMSPDLLSGDYVVTCKKNFSKKNLKKGQLIVFNSQSYGILIKKIVELKNNFVIVDSINPKGLNSQQIGDIKYSAIRSKVLFIIKNKKHR